MEEQKEWYRHKDQVSLGPEEVNQNPKKGMKKGKSNASGKQPTSKKAIRKVSPKKAAGVMHQGPENPIKTKGKKKKD